MLLFFLFDHLKALVFDIERDISLGVGYFAALSGESRVIHVEVLGELGLITDQCLEDEMIILLLSNIPIILLILCLQVHSILFGQKLAVCIHLVVSEISLFDLCELLEVDRIVHQILTLRDHSELLVVEDGGNVEPEVEERFAIEFELDLEISPNFLLQLVHPEDQKVLCLPIAHINWLPLDDRILERLVLLQSLAKSLAPLSILEYVLNGVFLHVGDSDVKVGELLWEWT